MRFFIVMSIFLTVVSLQSSSLFTKILPNKPKKIQKATPAPPSKIEETVIVIKNASLIACHQACSKVAEFELHEDNTFDCHDARLKIKFSIMDSDKTETVYGFYENYHSELYHEQKHSADCPLIRRYVRRDILIVAFYFTIKQKLMSDC